MGKLAQAFATLRRHPARLLLGLAALALAALWWWTAPPPVPAFADLKGQWKSSEAWLHARDGSLLSEVRVDFAQRRLAWVPLGEIAPALGQDVIAIEDRRFLSHGGVDWLALAGSLRDAFDGKGRRGASTLTMQTAAFLWPDIGRPGSRGWLDKLRQMRTAWALEASWNKRQILEAYLNLAPFRGENQGVGAGALALFGKRPAMLDPREAAVMAALLRNPTARPDQVAARACRLMKAEDCPALQVLAEAAAGTGNLKALDRGLAPHLAARLLTEPGMTVTTTIDPAVQALAVGALQHQLLGLGPTRARDGAVVVLDNRSGEVLAYVGGIGLGSTAASVDGASAPRQAGSTLKPHLYAQLIERKWLTAASILEDSPVQLDTASGLYVPRNYDNAFMGPVSVRRALANSLNVPAVRALLLDGVQDFRDRLADLGYDGLEADGSYYGFSLALGSAEVTLLEQANAYRTLANLGRWSPLRIKADDPAGEARQVLDPDRIDLHLTEPYDEAPEGLAPFRAVGSRRWRLDDIPPGLTGEGVIDDGDTPDPCPALVTVGTTGAALVMVNLEAAGTLAVTGHPEAVQAALRALAIVGAARRGARPRHVDVHLRAGLPRRSRHHQRHRVAPRQRPRHRRRGRLRARRRAATVRSRPRRAKGRRTWGSANRCAVVRCGARIRADAGSGGCERPSTWAGPVARRRTDRRSRHVHAVGQHRRGQAGRPRFAGDGPARQAPRGAHRRRRHGPRPAAPGTGAAPNARRGAARA